MREPCTRTGHEQQPFRRTCASHASYDGEPTRAETSSNTNGSSPTFAASAGSAIRRLPRLRHRGGSGVAGGNGLDVRIGDVAGPDADRGSAVLVDVGDAGGRAGDAVA